MLGEEAGGGGTARYVDSSVERLQVKVQRHDRSALRGGVQRPPRAAAPDRARGEFVAGVRYRAWQPPNCLHPTIGVHAPLVFDLIDTWNEPFDRRLHVARGASGRTSIRSVPSQRLRGGKPPRGAVFPIRSYRRAATGAAAGTKPRLSVHARYAARRWSQTDWIDKTPTARVACRYRGGSSKGRNVVGISRP